MDEISPAGKTIAMGKVTKLIMSDAAPNPPAASTGTPSATDE
jgi:hypothetical protein